MGNVVDIAKEAIDHGKVSVLLIIHKDTFFFYHIFAVNYRITVTQIKVVFSQSISVTNQCPR